MREATAWLNWAGAEIVECRVVNNSQYWKKGGNKVDKIKALWCDEDGVTTVEYALLLAVLVVGAVSIWTALKGSINTAVDAAGSELVSPGV